MFGTWKSPRPKPDTKSPAATATAGVPRAAPLKNSRPPASIASPSTLGSRGPSRSASRPASGAATVVPRGVSMKRRPPTRAS